MRPDPRASHRWLAGAVVLALGPLAACSQQQPTAPSPSAPVSSSAAPSRSSATSSASPTPSPTPAPDLRRPGAARRAVGELLLASGGLPVIKLDVTSTEATLSALKGNKVVAWRWAKGKVLAVESDIQYIRQAPFSPDDYALDDLGGLFDQAARISGSRQDQELQLVEYGSGQVLMTVTTRPESATVFFRPDGTPINQLDFTTAEGFTEALRDVTEGQQEVSGLGWSADGGLWADHAAKEDTITRVTRQARVPAWTADRRGNSESPTFRPGVVDPEVLARLVRELPQQTRQPGAAVSFEITRSEHLAMPLVRWKVGSTERTTTLGGTDVTGTPGT